MVMLGLERSMLRGADILEPQNSVENRRKRGQNMEGASSNICYPAGRQDAARKTATSSDKSTPPPARTPFPSTPVFCLPIRQSCMERGGRFQEKHGYPPVLAERTHKRARVKRQRLFRLDLTAKTAKQRESVRLRTDCCRGRWRKTPKNGLPSYQLSMIFARIT